LSKVVPVEGATSTNLVDEPLSIGITVRVVYLVGSIESLDGVGMGVRIEGSRA
jgi:hypothetical protein